MDSGTIDFRKAISGSSDEGIWKYNGIDYPFTVSDSSPYDVYWKEDTPPGSDEIKNRISLLAYQFFGDCKTD